MSRKESQNGEAELHELVFPVDELIQAREVSGRSQDDVAQELRLSLRYIQALETAEFEQLPSMVFARGYIQSYAKLLGLDADRYLAIFDELTTPGGKQRRRPIRAIGKVDQQAKSGDFAVRIFTWVILLALIGVSVWWWKTQSNPELLSDLWPAGEAVQEMPAEGDNSLQLNIEAAPEVDSFPPIAVEPVNVPVTDQADEVLANAEAVLEQAAESVRDVAAETAVAAESTVEQADVTVNTEPDTTITTQTNVELATAQVDKPAETADTQNEAVSAAGVSGVGRLLIDFADDCWISVKDVNGQVLAMRIKPAGSRLDVSGPGPLKIQIGKVSAVDTISFNGKDVDLSSYTRLDVAKLNLPASE
ncbi:RodZ domain-containing protein [Aliamphritea ceti]|uniref:RodZ domain-containing protein n=1 Tax=Aliamphritea ceti TaxID=1524258 RepID=UPI0021C499F6|nr:RodZ domain-containing protein [Aliamphritea ceti]